MKASLLSIDDLGDDDIRSVLDRARALADGGRIEPGGSPLIGLLFLSESTRTRVGFAAAAARLGGSAIQVTGARNGPQMSAAESFEDTLRTLTGMVDVLVVRTPHELDRETVREVAVAPIISGGHGSVEHPTQALIDLLAIECERGPVGEQRITLCGDLTMRATRSLLRLLGRMLPAQLTLAAPPGRTVDLHELSPQLSARTIIGSPDDLTDTDVLYLPGLPAGQGPDHLSADVRARYALDADRLAVLPVDAVVLCPLPVVDEVAAVTRRDPRVRMFAQSDRGVALRVAVLEHMLS